MSELLDKSVLAELREIMEDDFSMLLDTFLSESQKQYSAITDAWAAGDLEDLRRAAHSLKGSCGNIGALGLQSICEELEHRSRSGQDEGIDAMIADVKSQLGSVSVEIRSI